MFSKFDVIETIDMVEKEHLDIRTVTMGISLLSCIRGSAEETAQAVYDRVMKKAEHLVLVQPNGDRFLRFSASGGEESGGLGPGADAAAFDGTCHSCSSCISLPTYHIPIMNICQ